MQFRKFSFENQRSFPINQLAVNNEMHFFIIIKNKTSRERKGKQKKRMRRSRSTRSYFIWSHMPSHPKSNLEKAVRKNLLKNKLKSIYIRNFSIVSFHSESQVVLLAAFKSCLVLVIYSHDYDEDAGDGDTRTIDNNNLQFTIQILYKTQYFPFFFFWCPKYNTVVGFGLRCSVTLWLTNWVNSGGWQTAMAVNWTEHTAWWDGMSLISQAISTSL